MTITLDDVRNTGTPHINYNYDLVFPTVPGGGSGDVLRLHAISTQIPGFSTETFETNHHGFVIVHAGKKEYPRLQSAEYEESDSMIVLQTLRDWHDLMINPTTAIQVSADIYKVDGFLQLLNAAKVVVKTCRLQGCFPQDVGDVALDGATADATKISVSFSYDNWVLE